MSTMSLLSLYNKHYDGRSPTYHLLFTHLLSAEPPNHVFLYPTTIVSRRHAHGEPGGGQSSVCALHGMYE